ncbi:MAG: hypothetical protein CFE44_21405, partial [Burkholderiales bacterium PBB4]
EVVQFGDRKSRLPARILPYRAKVTALERHALESDVLASGQHLERIGSIRVGASVCLPIAKPLQAALPGTVRFSCTAAEPSADAQSLHARIFHVDDEPAAMEVPVTKLAARPHLELVRGRNNPVTVLSTKAVHWGLSVDDTWVTEDSGIALTLKAVRGYQLERGDYVLQVKLGDDPVGESFMKALPLMADLKRGELRTRIPLVFSALQLPGILNPVWFRVLHAPSGLAGDWQALHRSIVKLPTLGASSCDPKGSTLFVQGENLDLIDWASSDVTRTLARPPRPGDKDLAKLAACAQGLCLALDKTGVTARLAVKVQWIDDRLFGVNIEGADSCKKPD